MSLCFSGLDTPCCVQPVIIDVSPVHPLLQLAQVIPWQALVDMALPDLQRTTAKGKWWLGRKLRLRIHLGAFLLQWLYNLTDRQVDWGIKDNAAYQLFCGRGVVNRWHPPDHTKIEEFRSRLSPETQRQVANQVGVWATALGFADPSKMDVDSTIQEANIAYPSDAQLMVKIPLLMSKQSKPKPRLTGSVTVRIPIPRQAYCKTSGTNPSPKSVTYANTLRYYSMTILTVCPGTFVVPSIKSMRMVPTSFCTWRAFYVVE